MANFAIQKAPADARRPAHSAGRSRWGRQSADAPKATPGPGYVLAPSNVTQRETRLMAALCGSSILEATPSTV